MTPNQIETRARQKLNAVGDDLWSSAEIIENLLYDRCVEFATRTKCIQNTDTQSSVVSQGTYAKPGDCFEIKFVSYDGDKLQKSTKRIEQSINLSADLNTIGKPMYYIEWGDNFYLHENPDTAGLVISMDYYGEHQSITSASTLSIPTRWHNVLLDGVCADMAAKEIGDDRNIYYENKWEAGVQRAERAERLRKRGDAFARVQREEDLVVTDQGIV